tara:strand:+ start:60 stop:761 length:702 start_codon:yes stop_codon:yes gene_type:complete
MAASAFSLNSAVADAITAINACYVQADMLDYEIQYGTFPITSFSMTSEENEAESARVKKIRDETLTFKVLSDKLRDLCMTRFSVAFFELTEQDKVMVDQLCLCLHDMGYDYDNTFVRDAVNMVMLFDQASFDKPLVLNQLVEIQVFTEMKGHLSTRVTTVEEFVGQLKTKLGEISKREEQERPERLKELKKLFELRERYTLTVEESERIRTLSEAFEVKDLDDLVERMASSSV